MRIEIILDVDDSVDPSSIGAVDLWTRNMRQHVAVNETVVSVRRIAPVEEVQAFAQRVRAWLRGVAPAARA
jgi:hypothetical protein